MAYWIALIAAFVFGVLGIALNFFDKDKHAKAIRILTFVSLFSFVTGFIVEKKISLDDMNRAEKYNKSLTTKVDSLSSHLQMFIGVAESVFPNLPSSAALDSLVEIVPELLKGIYRIQPKLIRLVDKTHSYFNPKTKTIHTKFVFRSQSGELRDLAAEMTFENKLIKVSYRMDGLIVLERNSELQFTQDERGFVFFTDILHASSDLIIEIESLEELRIVSEKLNPNGTTSD